MLCFAARMSRSFALANLTTASGKSLGDNSVPLANNPRTYLVVNRLLCCLAYVLALDRLRANRSIWR